MFLDKEYFDGWMQRLSERLERIEGVRGDVEQPLSILPDGERLLDNYDLCRMLNISKRTLQRYRTSGEPALRDDLSQDLLPGIGRPAVHRA